MKVYYVQARRSLICGKKRILKNKSNQRSFVGILWVGYFGDGENFGETY